MDLEDFENGTAYARYGSFGVGLFSVDPEEDGYPLTVADYSGTAGGKRARQGKGGRVWGRGRPPVSPLRRSKKPQASAPDLHLEAPPGLPPGNTKHRDPNRSTVLQMSPVSPAPGIRAPGPVFCWTSEARGLHGSGLGFSSSPKAGKQGEGA